MVRHCRMCLDVCLHRFHRSRSIWSRRRLPSTRTLTSCSCKKSTRTWDRGTTSRTASRQFSGKWVKKTERLSKSLSYWLIITSTNGLLMMGKDVIYQCVLYLSSIDTCYMVDKTISDVIRCCQVRGSRGVGVDSVWQEEHALERRIQYQDACLCLRGRLLSDAISPAHLSLTVVSSNLSCERVVGSLLTTYRLQTKTIFVRVCV